MLSSTKSFFASSHWLSVSFRLHVILLTCKTHFCLTVWTGPRSASHAVFSSVWNISQWQSAPEAQPRQDQSTASPSTLRTWWCPWPRTARNLPCMCQPTSAAHPECSSPAGLQPTRVPPRSSAPCSSPIQVTGTCLQCCEWLRPILHPGHGPTTPGCNCCFLPHSSVFNAAYILWLFFSFYKCRKWKVLYR